MSKFKLLAATGLLALSFVSISSIARPLNGSMGVYLDAQGKVVGTWVVSCDGQFSSSGTRTAQMITNGHLWCNLP